MRATKIDPSLHAVIDDAENAFWHAIAEGFPEIGTGDFPPDAHLAFREACNAAVQAWYGLNKPPEAATARIARDVTVSMRPPRKGERGWWVKADNATDALAEILAESEEGGWIAERDHTHEADENEMIAVTITFGSVSALDVVEECPGCERPAHASETDDDGYHATCRPADAEESGPEFTEVTVKLRVSGDSDAVHDALENIFDSGTLQDALHEYSEDNDYDPPLVVTSAVVL